MATIQISQGDNLSALASKYGTTVDSLLASNKDNPAVKSANLIIAGGNLNIPDPVGAPPAGPASGTGTPNGALDATSPTQSGAASNLGSLANLRLSLREALNEAGKNRMANSYSQIAPLAGGVPGTLGSVVSMIRNSSAAPIESVFNDVTTAWKEDAAAAEKEKARIQDLRVQFGTAIPSGVTSLDEAIGYVTPLVDKENALRLSKMSQDQATDNDVETWAQFIAGGGAMSSVPSAIRTQAQTRAAVIIKENETKAKQEYQDKISLTIEKKIGTYESERQRVLSDGNLTVAEQRETINYIDGLELAEKQNKATSRIKSGDKNITNTLNPMLMINPNNIQPTNL
jgi:LysM repeat protein